jgi:hypothetical protein
VLTAIALTPSAPVLVPELAGAAAAEVAGFRSAAIAAAAALPDHWIAIGVGPSDALFEPDCGGTFAGYGADVAVAFSPDPVAEVRPMPLSGLFAGWLRGQAAPQARVRVLVFAADTDPQTALARGRALRAEIDAAPEKIGVLVVADGADTLDQSAPGGYDPGAQTVQDVLDEALAAGDVDPLTRLSVGIVGRVAYQVLAGLAPPRVRASEFIRGAPYGVGYFVGTWVPEN